MIISKNFELLGGWPSSYSDAPHGLIFAGSAHVWERIRNLVSATLSTMSMKRKSLTSRVCIRFGFIASFIRTVKAPVTPWRKGRKKPTYLDYWQKIVRTRVSQPFLTSLPPTWATPPAAVTSELQVTQCSCLCPSLLHLNGCQPFQDVMGK